MHRVEPPCLRASSQTAHPRSTLPCPQRLNTLPPPSSLNPQQADKNTAALQELNDVLLKDERIAFSLVPVGDGMALCTKR